MDVDELAKRFWGDIYFNDDRRVFTKKPPTVGYPRTFVQFILDPIYKIFSHTLAEEPTALRATLATLGVELKAASFKMDVKPLLKLVFAAFLPEAAAFVDMVVRTLPNPQQGAANKVPRIYTGPLTNAVTKSMVQCSADGPLVIHACKLYATDDRTRFDVYGRIFSGTVKPGQRVRVLGENYSADDEEDMTIQEVSDVSVYESRYRIAAPALTAGNWVLLSGVDESIVKTGTIVAVEFEDEDEEAFVFRPLRFPSAAIIKIAVEPMNPTELPKLLEGLRKINKTYPLVVTKVSAVVHDWKTRSGAHACAFYLPLPGRGIR